MALRSPASNEPYSDESCRDDKVLSELQEHLIPCFFGDGLGPFIIRTFSFKGEHLATLVISKAGPENFTVW